jgi:hypothetical protein
VATACAKIKRQEAKRLVGVRSSPASGAHGFTAAGRAAAGDRGGAIGSADARGVVEKEKTGIPGGGPSDADFVRGWRAGG